MSKRKAEEDEDKRPDPDGPWANNKQFHPTPSFYPDYRRELLRAAQDRREAAVLKHLTS